MNEPNNYRGESPEEMEQQIRESAVDKLIECLLQERDSNYRGINISINGERLFPGRDWSEN